MTKSKLKGSWKPLLALVLTASVAACSEGKQFVTHDEATDIADDAVDASGLEARIAALEEKNEEMEDSIDLATRASSASASVASAVAEQVAKNAKVANDNAVRDMTRRGACGKRWEAIEGGGQYLANIPCTEADLSD